MWGAPKHFIVQTSPEGLFRFEGPAFDTVQVIDSRLIVNVMGVRMGGQEGPLPPPEQPK